MSNIIPFAFDSHPIRVVIGDDNKPLFVAKDVAEALGYENTAQAVRQHCKRCKSLNELKVLDSSTLHPQTKLIPESDVYRLTMRSDLEGADRFQDWIAEDVLTSIRETGKYQAPHAVTTEVKPQIDANRLFRSNLSIAKLVFKGNQALLSANQATYKATGSDVLGNLGATHLLAPERDALLTATDIGKQIGLSGQKVNGLLEEKGLVLSFRDHKNRKQYEVTDAGAKLAEVLDTGKKHGDGTPVKQIKWYSRIIDLLKGEQAA